MNLRSAGFPGKHAPPTIWDHCCYQLQIETDNGVDAMDAVYCHSQSEEEILEIIRVFLREQASEA